MADERVPPLLLEPGDVIHLRHQHDCAWDECLSRWEIDAVVTENPACLGGRVAVKWVRLLGAGHAITGISLLRPDERVRRIGRALGSQTRHAAVAAEAAPLA